jgi:two-component system, NarL family, invasion response regulator UvrY
MGDTIRVAVCDDARAVKFFLRTVLEEDGDMEVVSTSSGGQEALASLAQTPADILLLDLLLPDVPEPADLVREIRERWPQTAILLMSNLPPAQLEKEAQRLATDGWTPKAHKPEQLRRSVRDALAAARAEPA